MKKAIPAMLLVFGLGAAALFAEDFWQRKKFSEWDEKEVRRILFDSPWAHTVELSLGSTGGRQRGRGGGGTTDTGVLGAEVANPGGRGGGGGGWEGSGGGRGGGGGSWGSYGGGSPDRGSSDGSSAPGIMVTIRFHSALPVKQAIAKARFGKEAPSSPEAAKFISREEPYYLVGVAGLPPQLVPSDSSTLKEKVLLKIKDKPPIRAEDARVERGRGLPGLLVFFPRASRPIVVGDGWVEVQLELRDKIIRRTFRLKNMVYQGKLEM
jgi:hypothetical protein